MDTGTSVMTFSDRYFDMCENCGIWFNAECWITCPDCGSDRIYHQTEQED